MAATYSVHCSYFITARNSSQVLASTKILRVFRIARIFKLIRLLKIGKVFKRIRDSIQVRFIRFNRALYHAL